MYWRGRGGTLRLEFTVDTPISYTNPFDPCEIDVWGEFTSPASDTIRINGFWDGADWKIRFAGAAIGQWSYVVKMQDSTSTAQQAGTFSVTSSSHPGWIRASTKDARYFEYSNGTPFYGVGVAIPWLLNPRHPAYYAPYEDLMLQLQQNGCNIFYYLMAAWWDNLLVTESTGYDYYDMVHAANMDQMVADAESHDIAILFSIWFNIMLADETHPWSVSLGYYGWMYNGFSNLTSCTDFFSDPISWEYQTRLYRYIIARWGYSRAIAFWHGPMDRFTRCSVSCSSLERVRFMVRCFGPVASAVIKGRLISVCIVVDSSILAFSAASRRRCSAFRSSLRSMP